MKKTRPKIPGRSLGLTFSLEQHTLPAGNRAQFEQQLAAVFKQSNSWVVVAALPLEQTLWLSQHLVEQQILVLNPRHRHDELRSTLLALQGPTSEDAGIVKAKSSDFVEINALLRSESLTLDLYKGAPGNFRSWNNQLRQPLLLHTHNAVIERAPLDRFMHQ